jgi:hypothetical protein
MRRFRCPGHIINFVVKATLSGNDPRRIFDNQVDDVSEKAESTSLMDAFPFDIETSRNVGGLAKLYNIVRSVGTSSRRVTPFLQSNWAQSPPDAVMFGLNNDTHWDSTYEMIDLVLIL